METKRILITGASGFIGSFLVEAALQKGFEVWAGIRASSSLRYLQNPKIQFINLHLSNKEKLCRQIKEFQSTHGKLHYVIHNAGLTKALKQEEFDRVNYQYTANLIDALSQEPYIPEKFILMSSLSVMGPGDEQHYTPIRPDDDPKPNTAYGISKLKAENYLRRTKNFPYIILRPTGVYGPREQDYFMMIKSILNGFDISAGLRQQHLSFIYVKDLTQAVMLAAESPLAGRTYFVADGYTYTDREYTALIRDILHKKYVIRLKIPLFIIKVVSYVCEFISQQTGKASTLNRDKFKIMQQRNWACDTSSIEKELHFHPQYQLRQGLIESIQWYKKNKWI